MGAGTSIPGQLQVWVLVVAVVSESVVEWRRGEGESEGRKVFEGSGCPEEKSMKKDEGSMEIRATTREG